MIPFSLFLNEHLVYGDNHRDVSYATLGYGQDHRSTLVMMGSIPDHQSNALIVATQSFFDRIYAKLLSDALPEIMDGYSEVSNAMRKAILELNPKIGTDVNFVLPANIPSSIIPVATDVLTREFEKYPKGFCDSIVTQMQYRSDRANRIEIGFGKITRESIQAQLKSKQRLNKCESPRSFIGFDYLRIDNNSRTINVGDNAIKHQNRMGTISDRKKQYILPRSDFSFNTGSTLVQTLKSLVKKFPEISSYTYVDSHGSDQAEYTVIDILSGIGRVAEQAANFDKRFHGGPIEVYHGTSLAAYNTYIKHQGLRPGQGVEYPDKIPGHSENLVYFSFDPSEVRKYAVRAGGAKGSVVIKATIHDISKIVFDEDNLWGGLRRIPDKIYEIINVRLHQLFPGVDFWEVGLDSPIPLIQRRMDSHWRLKSMYLKPLTKQQRNILDFITVYALKGSGTVTFGYKGAIPPRDIKVVEQFKSSPTSDLEQMEPYANKYHKILKTYKVFGR